uniref:cytochrome P450 n=1 Tax=Rhodococcus qingshengii TaxID=334542 RepID=UPI001C4DE04E|nr:cytochrome P450 [Rhodococcus qingshengii]
MGELDPAAPAVHIPERRHLPLLGHALSIPTGAGLMGYLLNEAKALGPIFRLRIFGDQSIIVTGPDLVAELSDPDRFVKSVHADLVRLRDIGGDGLFTAFNEEPNWRKAHDILMPAFSLEAMRGYHLMMVDAAKNLTNHWDRAARFDRAVDVSGDMTRLTFDTIGMCGFGYDFESFTRDGVHPFIRSMTHALNHAQSANERPEFVNRLQIARNRAYAQDIKSMQELIDSIIERRRTESPAESGDLLGRMLNTVDRQTGELLDDDNIRNQVMTFLIAGHETTGGALSFALYYLAKNPAVLAKAQNEVDNLWGAADDPSPTYDDIGKLTYIRQVLDESLRLWPTAPGYAVSPLEETVVGGRYPFGPDDSIQIFIPSLHRQPEWGDNVDSFDPDRFSPHRVESRPAHVYKPFGNGERACIGRQFALHEATLVLGLLVHSFRLNDANNYQLKIGMTLTIKPDGFTLHPKRRTPAERSTSTTPSDIPRQRARTIAHSGDSYQSLAIFHGSNLGTSSRIARDLAAAAHDRGLPASVAPLDEAVVAFDSITPDTLAVIVASSYNGRPTDDAGAFMKWAEALSPGSMEGLSYTVLGVGDRTWAATYQRVPTLIDDLLCDAGATRALDRGAADVSGGFEAAVQQWSSDLWDFLGDVREVSPVVAGDSSVHTLLEVPVTSAPEETSTPLQSRAQLHGMSMMTVADCSELVDMAHPLGRSKRFLRLHLPAGTTYRTGDHLAVLPNNADEDVEQVGARFKLDLDQPLQVHPPTQMRLSVPQTRAVTAREILRDFVELHDPATTDDVRVLAEHCACPPERTPLKELAALSRTEFEKVITSTNTSIFDLLQRYGSIELPFATLLTRLAPIRPRRYSISSSAIADPSAVELMVSVIDSPHRGGDTDRERYRGTASTHLARLNVEDVVLARVVPCSDDFRLSDDSTAIVISAGTGLAPFRGVIGDRLAADRSGPLFVYFGCDHPDVDYLHREELEKAAEQGVIELRPTFAFEPVDDHTFVQDRMIADHVELWDLITAGAQIRVCGDAARLGAGVESALLEIYARCAKDKTDENAARVWLNNLRTTGQYVCDVW